MLPVVGLFPRHASECCAVRGGATRAQPLQFILSMAPDFSAQATALASVLETELDFSTSRSLHLSLEAASASKGPDIRLVGEGFLSWLLCACLWLLCGWLSMRGGSVL